MNTIIKTTMVLAAIGMLAGCGEKKQPRALTIAYSNDMRGEIRSCGCVSADLGGLGRRATFLTQVRDTTGDFLLVEGGDFFSSELNYGKEKAELTLRAMSMMGYHGIVLGEDDLGFGIDYLLEESRRLKLPILAANLRDAAADTLIFPASREVTMPSGLRVGLVGVVSPRLKLPPQVGAGRVEIIDPVRAVNSELSDLRARCDVVVVLAHVGNDEMQRLATTVEGVDVIVYGHDPRPMRRVKRVGGAYPLQVAEDGRYMGVAYAVLGDDNRIRKLVSNVTPLSDYYADDEAIAKLFKSFDLSIAAKEKSGLPVGVLEARKGVEVPFVGAEQCRACHEDIYDHWSETRHAHAFQTLADRSREYDRDCTPCHTTGFYKAGGFENLKMTPDLANVQCESCHGNAAAHVEDPDVRTTVFAPDACLECHTAEQSPDFDFATFWERIEHPSGRVGQGGR